MGRKERRAAKLRAKWLSDLNTGNSVTIPDGPEIDFFFADDARQRKPSRPGLGQLVAIGGINVPAESVREIDEQLNVLCAEYSFPPGQEFKWSPGRELWMHKNLTDSRRLNFIKRVMEALTQHEAMALIVIEDTNYATATGAKTPELDVTKLFLERVNHQCTSGDSHGFVIVDRPSGDRRDEDGFLADCLETLHTGTRYVKPTRIAHNVLSAPSHMSRLLQAADVVTSCTLAVVAGETQYAPPVFEMIKPLLDQGIGHIGGYGLKLHPDYRLANLYHWLVGDTHYWRGGAGAPLPLRTRPYFTDPFVV